MLGSKAHLNTSNDSCGVRASLAAIASKVIGLSGTLPGSQHRNQCCCLSTYVISLLMVKHSHMAFDSPLRSRWFLSSCRLVPVTQNAQDTFPCYMTLRADCSQNFCCLAKPCSLRQEKKAKARKVFGCVGHDSISNET